MLEMKPLYKIVIEYLIFILPCYIANATPVVLKNLIDFKKPLDFKKYFIDGKRIFGDGKTIEGFVSGTLVGTLIGLILSIYGYHTLLGSFILSLGAMLGDLLGSFIKRRLGIARGKPCPIIDQLTFVIISLLLYHAIISYIPIIFYILAIIITMPLHLLSNLIAYLCHIKEVPW